MKIVGEAVLAVSHNLIAPEPVDLEQIDTVLTHPQVPGQCTRLLRGELAHARVVAAGLDGRGGAHGDGRAATRAAPRWGRGWRRASTAPR